MTEISIGVILYSAETMIIAGFGLLYIIKDGIKYGEITATDAMILTGMKRTNFYKQVKLLNIR